MSIYPRISGRLGNVLDLNITFYKNGVPADPYAIRKVSIYRSAVQDENLVAQFLITEPENPNYPSPLQRELDTGEIGKCGTTPPPGTVKPGVFHLFWEVPKEGINVPDIFFDVWSFIPEAPTHHHHHDHDHDHDHHHHHHDEDLADDGDNDGRDADDEDEEDEEEEEEIIIEDDHDVTHPHHHRRRRNDDDDVVTEKEDAAGDPILPSIIVPGGTDDHDFDDDEDRWKRCCNRFWLYADGFFCDDGLENIRLGFEAMDSKFNQPEIRMLEVGIMPLPLFDYDFNKIAPIIPQLRATFTMFTDNCENLILNEPMRIGLRTGTYRSNPFTLQYTFDSSRVLKGSYKYQVSLHLPNGETRVSPRFNIQVS